MCSGRVNIPHIAVGDENQSSSGFASLLPSFPSTYNNNNIVHIYIMDCLKNDEKTKRYHERMYVLRAVSLMINIDHDEVENGSRARCRRARCGSQPSTVTFAVSCPMRSRPLTTASLRLLYYKFNFNARFVLFLTFSSNKPSRLIRTQGLLSSTTTRTKPRCHATTTTNNKEFSPEHT